MARHASCSPASSLRVVNPQVHKFRDSKECLAYSAAFFKTILREWGGIDHHRLDKYLSLTRKCFRELIVLVTSQTFDDEELDGCVAV